MIVTHKNLHINDVIEFTMMIRQPFFVDRLRKFLYHLAMTTQRQAAKKLGVTYQHLNAVLRNRVTPSIRLAMDIESVLGIPAEKFRPDLAKIKEHLSQ